MGAADGCFRTIYLQTKKAGRRTHFGYVYRPFVLYQYNLIDNCTLRASRVLVTCPDVPRAAAVTAWPEL